MRATLFVRPILIAAVVLGCNDVNTPTAPRLSPTAALEVPVVSAVPRVPLSVGTRHNCALTLPGQAYCWGDGTVGQLGNNSTSSSTTPTPVTQNGLPFQSIASGLDFSCALTTAGEAYCWGTNAYGELGTGDHTNRLVPTPVVGGLTFTKIVAAEDNFACARTSTEKAYCWGKNTSGQLGNGTTTDSPVPIRVTLGRYLIADISAYWGHACALSTGGRAGCWGSNGNGELGDGTRTNSSIPVAVSGGLKFGSLVAYSDHTCGLTTVGQAYCWGGNTHGDLGDGTGSTQLRPVPVTQAGGLLFGQLGMSAGWNSCSLSAASGGVPAGQAYCWGMATESSAPGTSVIA